MWSERDSAAARHHELSLSIRRIAEARELRKYKAAATLAKLRKVYEDRRKVQVEAHVEEWCELRERVSSLTSDLERRTLKLQAVFGLASEAARRRQEADEVWKGAD